MKKRLIAKNKSICQGDAFLKGTRTTVAYVIFHTLVLNITDEEFLGAYDYITRDQLVACKNYYKTHKTDIDSQLKELQEDAEWEAACDEFDENLINKTQDFLNNPGEDIYTEKDGEPL